MTNQYLHVQWNQIFCLFLILRETFKTLFAQVTFLYLQSRMSLTTRTSPILRMPPYRELNCWPYDLTKTILGLGDGYI